MRNRLLGCVAATLWIVSSPALAQDFVSGISANPASVFVGDTVTFRVEGQGICDVTLDYGDGDSDAFNNAALPLADLDHVYDSPGSFPARVTSGDCNIVGQDEIQISVRIRLERREFERGFEYIPGPRIERIFGFGITPGLGLLVGGSGFGDQAGKVWFIASPTTSHQLEVENWFDDAIGGLVPAGVHDNCVFGIQIETADGKLSPVFPVPVPTEVRQFPTEDVVNLECGRDANAGGCTGASFEGSCQWGVADILGIQEGVVVGSPPPTIRASHENCWGTIGDDSGTDRYQISLSNGWVLDHAEFSSHLEDETDPDEGRTTPASGTLPSGFVPGATSWRPSIDWVVTPNDKILYTLDVFIRGPVCTSHK